MGAKARLYPFDFVRAVAITFVVAVHSLMVVDSASVSGVAYQTAFRTLFFTANALFFMMSGKFNLKVRSAKDELTEYYVKKIRNIGVPLVVVFLLRTLYDMYPQS